MPMGPSHRAQIGSIVDRELLAESGFLARGHDRLRMQVGPENHQRVDREVETQDAHIPFSMRRVYHHFRGRATTIGITGGWVRSHRVRSIC
ncbi:hypothetical protein J1N35_029262 [Gossypium stocksii]|uniref:Uncharacterized protein n=1 Tax=Gossypium stocksii TaxID=47602 RepID=A0A9D3UXG7_9ROSI|nr:hypothetical protein J1N35_029262 [Gossypium stocksii]